MARGYILCTEGEEGQPLPPFVDRSAADPAWEFIRLRAGHAAHVTAPADLTAALVGLARD